MTFKKKEKQGAGRKTSTRQLMGIKAFTEYGLETDQHGALVYFIVQPTNLPGTGPEHGRRGLTASAPP